MTGDQQTMPFAVHESAEDWHRTRALLRLQLAAIEYQCFAAGFNLRQTAERTETLRTLIDIAERRYREACV